MGSLSRGTKAELFSILPAGTVLPFAGATAPDGWAICDGSTVSRTEYSELYMAIGDAWGNGDGSTTFHLPDLRGRFLRGVDNPSGIPGEEAGRDPDAGSRTAANAGGNSGNAVGSVQDHQNASHSHGLVTAYQSSIGANNSSTPINRFAVNSSRNDNSTGDSGGNESRPKNANVNYIIKL